MYIGYAVFKKVRRAQENVLAGIFLTPGNGLAIHDLTQPDQTNQTKCYLAFLSQIPPGTLGQLTS